MSGRKPDFFIIGAPKCGTTSLAAWLDAHPEVCMSKPKEPHFFAPARHQRVHSLAEYERCFAHADPGARAVGEASTMTMYFPSAIEDILAYNPEARFVFCVRNPIAMTLSLHNMLYYASAHGVADVAEAWDSPLEIAPNPASESPIPLRQLYRWACALGTHYARLGELIPAERLLPVILEDVIADETRTLGRVAEHLGIPPGAHPYPRANERKKPRIKAVSRLGRWLSVSKRRLGIRRSLRIGAWMQAANTARGEGTSALTPEMHAMLGAHFEPEIRKLETLLGRDFSGWLVPPAHPGTE